MLAKFRESIFAFVLSAAVGILAPGCADIDRPFTISTEPIPAAIKIDGSARGLSPVRETLHFDANKQSYVITALRSGYKERQIQIDRDAPANLLLLLEPETRTVTFNILPAPAELAIDGRPVGKGELSTFTTTLPFTKDDLGNWTSYKVTATRSGWQAANLAITFTDPKPDYLLNLEPMRKDVRVTTTPPGASVLLDGQEIGASPAAAKDLPFFIHPETGNWNQHVVKALKPGYDPIEVPISWDQGQTDYAFAFKVKQKTVRIVSAPPGAIMTMDGKPLTRDADGACIADLSFVPDERGTLPTYTVAATKKTAETDWYPSQLVINWDNGKIAYSVALREITEVQIPLLQGVPERIGDGWEVLPKWVQVLAMKAVSDPGASSGKEPARKIHSLADLGQLDTIGVSPDGSQLVASVLSTKSDSDLRAQIVLVKSDGGAAVEHVTDGRSLDLQPSFTPDGKQIVYSSNRGGRRQSIWSVSAFGQPGITKLTTGETNDFWPTVDDTRHLYYETLVDSRSDPRIFVNELSKTLTTDVTQDGGSQPHVNAAADTLLYVALNSKTGKRELYKMSLKDGTTSNLTNSPDFDSFDPAWSPNGDRIAFVSDRGVDALGRHNLDVWVMDPAHPEMASQVTTNGSQDDCPAWDPRDPTSSALYFRSNRGGEWAIWRAVVK